jgi:predicted transcriptional regulator
MAKASGSESTGKVPSKKPRVSVYVNEEIKERLEKLAIKEKRTISNLLYAWIIDKIDEAQNNGHL